MSGLRRPRFREPREGWPGWIASWLLAWAGSAMPTSAWSFHDGPAYAQRMAQYTQVMAQWNQMLQSSGEQLMILKAAYMGLKDWRSFGWTETLRVVDCPWFDGIAGIDDIRRCTTMTLMSTEQAQQLWDNYDFYQRMLTNPRYASDAWYRAKVDSLLRQSQRAQAMKAAILLQFKAENRELIEDVQRIKRVKREIQVLNRAPTVNAVKLASLQAELAATEAKFEGNALILRNQRAIMFLLGENDAQRAFIEVVDRGWIRGNTRVLRDLGAQFSRRR